MVNGHVIPYTPIAVDFWKIRNCTTAKVFFLSHCHADHTEGLSSTWKKPIYCSEVTAELVKQNLNVDEKLLRPLELNCSHIISLDAEGTETMTVTLVDANHCPGATMFIFQGYFGNILYTGDCRFHKDMFSEIDQLRCKIDTMYLDNTYCSPSCTFPSRKHCEEEVLNIVKGSEDADSIVIGVRSLGKEDLLVKIAEFVNEWIGVSEKMYKTAEILNLPDVFTTDILQCRIITRPLHLISAKSVRKWNESKKTVVILPSALYHNIQGRPFSNLDNVHIVPFSDHSSYTELHEFVSAIMPKRIIPIVSGKARGPMGIDLDDRSDMSCFNKYINSSSILPFNIPKSVKRFMSYGGAVSNASHLTQKRKTHVHSNRKLLKKRKLGVAYDSPEEEFVDGETVVYKTDFEDTCISEIPAKSNEETSWSPKCTSHDLLKSMEFTGNSCSRDEVDCSKRDLDKGSVKGKMSPKNTACEGQATVITVTPQNYFPGPNDSASGDDLSGSQECTFSAMSIKEVETPSEVDHMTFTCPESNTEKILFNTDICKIAKVSSKKQTASRVHSVVPVSKMLSKSEKRKKLMKSFWKSL